MTNPEVASVIELARTVVAQSNVLLEAVQTCTREAITVVTELRADLMEARIEIDALRVQLAENQCSEGEHQSGTVSASGREQRVA